MLLSVGLACATAKKLYYSQMESWQDQKQVLDVLVVAPQGDTEHTIEENKTRESEDVTEALSIGCDHFVESGEGSNHVLLMPTEAPTP